jgi:uncharacterized protein DUF6311
MKQTRWPALAAAGIGFLWFLRIGGWHTLNPTAIDWILAGDWRQHWLGWLFFRREPWTFPLGTLHTLPFPVGTSIGFTDSNPIVSLALKPFSPWLPAEMQFIGPWLALCFVLQGYMGARLARVVTSDSLQQFLGGCFFVLSPVLAARLGHDTLCAHWLVLGLLYLGLKPYASPADARRASGWATAAVMLAAAIHPYLTAMTCALALAMFVRFWRTDLMTLRRAAFGAAATMAGMFLVWGVIGYIGKSGVGSPGFGVFTADLLTLFDPLIYSRLVPNFHLAAGHWEGIGFLGIGGLAAAVVALTIAIRRRVRLPRFAKPVIIVVLLMAVYALSSDITIGDFLLLRIRRVYSYIEPLTSAFRASGRFIWPLHYLVLLAGIWGLTRVATGRASKAVATALLALAVVVQAADLKQEPSWGAPKRFKQAPAGEFTLALGHYRHMVVYPPQILGGCGERYEEDYVYRYMLEAYRLNLTYNSGIFSRFSWDAMQAACGQLDRDVEHGKLDAQTIYVVWPGYVDRFTGAGGALRERRQR